MDTPRADDLSKKPPAQPAVRTSPEAAAAFKAALAQARKEGFAVTPHHSSQLPATSGADAPPHSPAPQKWKCYCCGHSNPAIAYECEKCYVRL